jgi:hypothetical protein
MIFKYEKYSKNINFLQPIATGFKAFKGAFRCLTLLNLSDAMAGLCRARGRS